MNFLEVIKNRRSVREFARQAISEEMIDQLIEALIWAPSAGNLQARKFYFVFNKEIKEKLAQAALGQDFIVQAPLVVVGCLDKKIRKKYGERGEKIYGICDVAMAIENLMLLAHSLGLGSCPVGAFDEREVITILNLPENLKPILLVPIGSPAEKPVAPKRLIKNQAVEFVK
ncbi:MAG: nitroreductase family protein [Minisyncoccales bacterium]